jgi:hypothetical protein
MRKSKYATYFKFYGMNLKWILEAANVELFATDAIDTLSNAVNNDSFAIGANNNAIIQ